jgi:hypothetical protein
MKELVYGNVGKSGVRTCSSIQRSKNCVKNRNEVSKILVFFDTFWGCVVCSMDNQGSGRQSIAPLLSIRPSCAIRSERGGIAGSLHCRVKSPIKPRLSSNNRLKEYFGGRGHHFPVACYSLKKIYSTPSYTISPIPKLRHHRDRIAARRHGKCPARTRAGIKHPFLRPVDRDPEFGNISRNAGIGHDLEMDR